MTNQSDLDDTVAAIVALDVLDCYILEGTELRRASTLEWSTWFATADRTVRKTDLGRVEVSTVIVGLGALPFETLISGGDHDGERWKYHTYADAVNSHNRIVRLLRQGRDPWSGVDFVDLPEKINWKEEGF